MPGCAKPISVYQRIEPKYRGQRRGIVKVDARTKEGRLLRDARRTLLEHLGPNVTAVQKTLVERAAWLELKIALLDAKIASRTDTTFDSNVYLAWVGALRRLYQTLGLEHPAPSFADIMKRPPGRPKGSGTKK